MPYLATSINDSAVIVGTLAEDFADLRGRALAFNDDGLVTTAKSDTDMVIGVALMNNDKDALNAGNDVNIQIKDIGHVIIGAAVKKGQALSVDASGRFVPATAGQGVFAIALDAAENPDDYISAMVGHFGTAKA
ncbi:MAG: hypothetical protein Q4C56_04020 [Peptococcaceae bacterium]|nr:hypothetical protein [Peptococcaceae bacterium]